MVRFLPVSLVYGGGIDIIRLVVQAVFDLFRIEFDLLGFTLSFWQVFAFTVVASLVLWIIREVLLGG